MELPYDSNNTWYKSNGDSTLFLPLREKTSERIVKRKIESYEYKPDIKPDILTDYSSVLTDGIITTTMERFLDYKNCSKSYLNNIIPGLDRTAAYDSKGEVTACKNMTPQGVCCTDRYLLVSAYCNADSKNKDKCASKHKSVIYVLNKNNGSYITTLNLSTDSHVGGLAYDPNGYVYVADSTNKVIWALKVEEINKLSMQGKNHINISFDSSKSFSTQKHNPSFITYYAGDVYVGNCEKKDLFKWSSYMIPFHNGVPKEEKIIYLPVKAQGVGITEDKKGNPILLVSSSLGRDKDRVVEKVKIEDGNENKNN